MISFYFSLAISILTLAALPSAARRSVAVRRASAKR